MAEDSSNKPAQEATDEAPTAPQKPEGKGKGNGRGNGKGGGKGNGKGRGKAAQTDGQTDGQDAGTDGKGEKKPIPKVVVRPMARKARRRRRHVAIYVSFFLIVVLPALAIGWYVETATVDQYASDVGFTVRQEEGASSAMALTGIAQLAGGTPSSGAADADILNEFIRSQALVKRIDTELDLWAHYSAPYDDDPWFALKPGGTIEDLSDYWQRMAQVDYDSATGLIGLEVRAFEPDFAQKVAAQILKESQELVNDLNAQSRNDILRAAEEDVQESLTRLKAAREELVKFRTRTQIVDPESDLRTRMGVQNSLQQQLAQALIDYDLVAGVASDDDPRVVNAARRIEVIRDRLAEERESFAADQSADGGEGYPALIAEYESLAVDREYAEQTYRAALAQYDAAVSNATRQSRYLAAYLMPTLPETAEYPRRTQTVIIAVVFLLMFWALFVLIYYSLRDRS